MKSKKANALVITLTVIVAIGFLSTLGFLIFSGDSKVSDEDKEAALQEQLALQNALLEQQQEVQQTTVPSASFGSSTSSSSEDDEEPDQIDNLHMVSRDTTWIYWDWDNPDDDDFDKNLIYIDGSKVATTSSSFYNATGLNPGVSYTIEVKTRDFDGNINEDEVSDTATTLGSGTTNNTPSNPTSATSISNLVVASRWFNNIYWSWSNPTSSLFNQNVISVDGVNVQNTTNNYYNATGLLQNTVHTISITTNLNATAVTNTVSTCYEFVWNERQTNCP